MEGKSFFEELNRTRKITAISRMHFEYRTQDRTTRLLPYVGEYFDLFLEFNMVAAFIPGELIMDRYGGSKVIDYAIQKLTRENTINRRIRPSQNLPRSGVWIQSRWTAQCTTWIQEHGYPEFKIFCAPINPLETIHDKEVHLGIRMSMAIEKEPLVQHDWDEYLQDIRKVPKLPKLLDTIYDSDDMAKHGPAIYCSDEEGSGLSLDEEDSGLSSDEGEPVPPGPGECPWAPKKKKARRGFDAGPVPKKEPQAYYVHGCYMGPKRY